MSRLLFLVFISPSYSFRSSPGSVLIVFQSQELAKNGCVSTKGVGEWPDNAPDRPYRAGLARCVSLDWRNQLSPYLRRQCQPWLWRGDSVHTLHYLHLLLSSCSCSVSFTSSRCFHGLITYKNQTFLPEHWLFFGYAFFSLFNILEFPLTLRAVHRLHVIWRRYY